MKKYDNVVIFDHPLIKHKIAILRDEKTGMKEFRELVEEITTLMTYECLKDVETVTVKVKTPLEETEQQMVPDNSIAIVPILRAGLGMVNGIHVLFPTAKVGHIGMYRDEETLQPHEYYCKLPDGIENKLVLLVDPCLQPAARLATLSQLLKREDAKTLSLWQSSARPREFPKLPKLIPTWIFTFPLSTAASTRTATFCPVSATQATVCSARNN